MLSTKIIQCFSHFICLGDMKVMVYVSGFAFSSQSHGLSFSPLYYSHRSCCDFLNPKLDFHIVTGLVRNEDITKRQTIETIESKTMEFPRNLMLEKESAPGRRKTCIPTKRFHTILTTYQTTLQDETKA